MEKRAVLESVTSRVFSVDLSLEFIDLIVFNEAKLILHIANIAVWL